VRFLLMSAHQHWSLASRLCAELLTYCRGRA
jgi:hypothetical protein